MTRPSLDCQDCGTVVRWLTDAEAQQVARDPYAYIAFCFAHGEARMRDIERARENY